MKKTILFASVIFIFLIPIGLACTTPLVLNQYGVPVNIFGGLLPINASKYPSNQKLIPYNLTVNNTNKNDAITVRFIPNSGLINYVFEAEVTVQPKSKMNVSLFVYIDGPDKAGTMTVSGTCGSITLPDGVITVDIDGRGNNGPQSCGSTKYSCGLFPDCQDLSQQESCYNGYYRTYSCVTNSPKYTERCTTFCCQQYGGVEASCQSISGVTTCITPKTCQDECSFTGNTCSNSNVYSCVLQQDGCYDLVLADTCSSSEICYVGSCVDQSSFIGKIAYLCASDSCNDNIEQDMINLLKSQHWLVNAKAYNKWTNAELDNYNLMVCSDQSAACKSDVGSVIYNEFKQQGRPFVEITDYTNSHQAYRFGFAKATLSSFYSGNSFLKTTEDVITKPYGTITQIFTSSKKFVVVPDYQLLSPTKDLGDVSPGSGKSTLFKVKETGSQGRYVYIGWFYQGKPSELTSNGLQLFNRTIVWASCGDSCLESPSTNKPPTAILTANPYPLAYEGQNVTFDASLSFDPNNDPLLFSWNLGDGVQITAFTSTSKVSHVYSTKGDYNITVYVTDGEFTVSDTKTISVLPTIKQKVALLCEKDCSKSSESLIKTWLQSKGYTVTAKNKEKWTDMELNGYDFMVCASSGGCNVPTTSAAYKKHTTGKMGFLEIPDYLYLLGASKFGYVSWQGGYSEPTKSLTKVGTHQITSPFTNPITIYSTPQSVAGTFTYRLSSSATSLTSLPKDGSTGMFKADASGDRGRYAYVGWIYKSSPFILTSDGDQLLLRTVRWIQCGNADVC